MMYAMTENRDARRAATELEGAFGTFGQLGFSQASKSRVLLVTSTTRPPGEVGRGPAMPCRWVDMEKSKEKWWRVDNPIMWAVVASSIFFALLTYLGRVPTCNVDLFPKGDCPAKWRHIVSAPINEVGDTLAGLAGVLAFVWLVATVLLQAHELREQRKEFREQREATQDMAKALATQADIFEDEKLHRSQARAEQLLDQKVHLISLLANRLIHSGFCCPDANVRAMSEMANQSAKEWEMSLELTDCLVAVAKMTENSRNAWRTSDLEGYKHHLKLIGDLASLLRDFDELQYELSAAQMQRIFNMSFDELRTAAGEANIGMLSETFLRAELAKVVDQ